MLYQKQPGKTEQSYTIDHSAGTFVYDRAGRVRLFVRHEMPVEDLVHDRATLVITDFQWDQLQQAPALRMGDDVVVITVPNGSSVEERERMALKAAQIRHGTGGADDPT